MGADCKTPAEQLADMMAPLAGMELSASDRRTLEWLSHWESCTTDTVASLLSRARAAAPLDGDS